MKIIPLKQKEDTRDLYIYLGKVANEKAMWLCKDPETKDIFVVIGYSDGRDINNQFMVPDKVVILTTDKDDQKHNQLLDFMTEMDEDEFPLDAKCFKCGEEASQSWDICSDDRKLHYVCDDCDIALNELVLKFMGFKDWKEKIEKYKKSLKED